MVFALEEDARRVLGVLPKRLGKYGLSLHPEKTRLVLFRPSCKGLDRAQRSDSFTFLGFTHRWYRSFKKCWVVKRCTAKDRFRHALKEVSRWCHVNRHRSVPEKQKMLASKLRGHAQYYGITGNGNTLPRFFQEVLRVWRKWLSRRSQRARLNWEQFNRLLQRYPLPSPVVVDSVYRGAAKP